MFEISTLRNIFIKFRTSVKLISLILIAALVIVGTVSFAYKPIYSVTLNGEFIGYCEDKSKLQKKINEYMNSGGENNLAFIEIENLPEYQLCLLKKGITTNDDEIFQKVIEQGIDYYRYYAIMDNAEEKVYVSSIEDAEEIIKQLKEKCSDNQDTITYIEKYETELEEFQTIENAVATLYKEPQVKKNVEVAKKVAVSESFTTSRNMSNTKAPLGIDLIKPISGTISSRFGSKSSVRSGAHTGLDIAAPKGTPIKAAASGTVIFAGKKGSYGNLVVISHGNGIQTFYGHCSTINVTKGDYVSQGAVVAKVGSTGNSTGNHLHLEIRVNGVARNPQNYLYK